MRSKFFVLTFFYLSSFSLFCVADVLEERNWAKSFDDFEGTTSYVSPSSISTQCMGNLVPSDVVGTVEGEISKDSFLKVAIIAGRVDGPIESGTLRIRNKKGILDLPTNCSSEFEGNFWVLTCMSLVLSHEAKEMAKTKFLRLDTPSKNFEFKTGGQCNSTVASFNKIGRDFYEATTGDLSLSAEIELEQEKIRRAEEAAAKRKAEEEREAEEQRLAQQARIVEEKAQKKEDRANRIERFKEAQIQLAETREELINERDDKGIHTYGCIDPADAEARQAIIKQRRELMASLEKDGLRDRSIPVKLFGPCSQYPRRAQTRGIGGYVLLGSWIGKDGSVLNTIVLEAEPKGLFNRAAINAERNSFYLPARNKEGEPEISMKKSRYSYDP